MTVCIHAAEIWLFVVAVLYILNLLYILLFRTFFDIFGLSTLCYHTILSSLRFSFKDRCRHRNRNIYTLGEKIFNHTFIPFISVELVVVLIVKL